MNPAFSAGSPPMTIRRTSTSGTPRKMSVYTTAATRTGAAARPGRPRTIAMTSAKTRTSASATTISLMLVWNPSQTWGTARRKSSGLKNVCRNFPTLDLPPGD